ncbi:SSI family serine proteinase inhibitor [Streptomyces sp. NRRL F-2799]|uniref:SSI family serine proteinase inhibitor n=1 Tax=Streptomyces sp. NRRL F-2799 TaxID=1463844 RepID=UPI00068FA4F9|nr:SSI family serine proteinase inhibitor [Streptomyces sp. NRRL F-2799]
MSALPRRGIAPLAVSLLCGLAAAPAYASPTDATSVTPALATPTQPTSAIPAHATTVTPALATPTQPTSAIPAPASPAPANARLTATPALPPPPLPDDATGDHLTLVVHGAGAGHDGVRQLFCHPEAGDHPDPAAACRVLDENTRWGQNTFAPVPPDSICTMIDGGSVTAHVTGYWAGRPVDADFSRRNGCEIARWDRLVPFLPRAGS